MVPKDLVTPTSGPSEVPGAAQQPSDGRCCWHCHCCSLGAAVARLIAPQAGDRAFLAEDLCTLAAGSARGPPSVCIMVQTTPRGERLNLPAAAC